VRPGEVAFDIGANFGQHCPLLADLVGPRGRLVAFEPDPVHRAALTRTVTQRGNGSLLPYALGDRSCEESLFVPDDHTMSSLANWTGRETMEVRCELTTLDTLVERGVVPLPDFIKCDVEGAELRVFRGARRTLDRTDAPILLYEANAGASAAFGNRLDDSTRFLATLTSARYAFSWVRPGGRLEPLHGFPSDVALLNLVAVPASKLDRVT
jgi:FkbM family methyltransferase